MEHPKHRSRSDEALLALAITDTSTFGAFYERHVDTIERSFQRRVRDDQLAFDLTAETFARALAGVRRFRNRGDGSATAWLWTIAENEFRNWSRMQRARSAARSRMGIARIHLDVAPGAEEISSERLDARFQTPRLQRAWAALAPAQQLAVQRRIVDEAPYRRIASEMHSTEELARARVSRGLHILRSLLRQEAREVDGGSVVRDRDC